MFKIILLALIPSFASAAETHIISCLNFNDLGTYQLIVDAIPGQNNLVAILGKFIGFNDKVDPQAYSGVARCYGTLEKTANGGYLIRGTSAGTPTDVPGPCALSLKPSTDPHRNKYRSFDGTSTWATRHSVNPVVTEFVCPKVTAK